MLHSSFPFFWKYKFPRGDSLRIYIFNGIYYLRVYGKPIHINIFELFNGTRNICRYALDKNFLSDKISTKGTPIEI